MRCEDILASGLRDKRRTVSRAECEAAAAAWSNLRRKDAPLRIVRDGRLISAPLTHFDAVLTAQASAKGRSLWR
ncbi:DUF3658 domain-containing protein [Methylobacterium sp. A54F]